MVLLYPITTEKAIGLIELQNKIIFIVEANATKKDVKDEVEQRFGVKVAKVTVLNTTTNKKKAFVKLKPPFKADDIAAKLKIA
ncbi:50S ribosomal protein L23 [Candidatus Micrarchaeota archaeon]|nr:50S ribosomal protein L23 [Candidatus Micrarchaeota archaeon]